MDTQVKIEEKWNKAASEYNDTVRNELKSFKAAAWLDLIQKQIPENKTLQILDVGTGPGFFTLLMGRAGHQVTAIDSSPEMIEKAGKNAEGAGIKAEFAVMDSHRLDFADQSFDLVISRNVTWTLHDPVTAYGEWKRVLKPGGRLLIFDANWHLYQYDSGLMEEVKKRDWEYRSRYGEPDDDYYGPRAKRDESSKLLLHDQHRPSWDNGALAALGFAEINNVINISDRVWDEKEQLLYGANPLFMISARKAATIESSAWSSMK
ncbi:class I SAM-dependent methyltransferase [Desulfosporosinus youngiae]|uniref:Methylase involved in ubiquinone/menaquinone biosynthesis n=1 Tax=Desulfosporosinus youngiae DSM 17734 TaxID=768710 RepID=H5XX97_9FIRM|nr:class I SAM-dependent methyltransferase [Desulfosporosinus youngiae]EHQ91037.1 methylase involved in ubiquinone/menaquinone biosynthesis [Desulfosporosinus youngiae DSM 17734]